MRPDPSPWRTILPSLAMVTLLATSALAETTFTAFLDGPKVGSDSPATGTALFILNAEETEVEYFIEYSGMVGTETIAHIHNAPPGVIGPVFLNLEYGSPKAGIWDVGPFEVAELRAGRVNILIHSDAYPLAEIRGDLFPGSPSSVDLPTSGNLPVALELRPNYPNPFNPSTTLVFGLPREGRILLDIFNVRGHRVRSLLSETRPAGFHSVIWDGTDDSGARVASGVYLYRVVAGGRVASNKLTLVE